MQKIKIEIKWAIIFVIMMLAWMLMERLTGLVITALITVISPLTQIITVEIISPHYFSNAMQYAVEEGKMTTEQAEKYFNLGNYIVQTVIFTPIMGIITTAIVAIFTKRKGS